MNAAGAWSAAGWEKAGMEPEGGIRIVFRGVRGSYPMPGTDTVRFGGNTSCQEIRAGGRLVIFDAGTGIIGLGRDMERRNLNNCALFFSHSHPDHTNGFLYFKPAYRKSSIVSIFGPREESGGIMAELEKLSDEASHPVRLRRMGMDFTCANLENGDVVVWKPGDARPRLAEPGAVPDAADVAVRVFRNSHHTATGVLNYRLEHAGKSYVYATDTEGIEAGGDPELAAFARGADVLAHDGQYTSEEYAEQRRGWGHSTVRMAINTARMSGISRLAIIHHDPEYGDDQLESMEREGKEAFPGLFFARENQELGIA